jgi:hypothetical protein
VIPTLHRNALRQARRFAERSLAHRLGRFRTVLPTDGDGYPDYVAVCRSCGRQCIVHFPLAEDRAAAGDMVKVARTAIGLHQVFAIGGRAVAAKCPSGGT